MDWTPGAVRVMSQPGWSLAVKLTCYKLNTKARNGEKRPNTAEHIAHTELNDKAKLVVAERTLCPSQHRCPQGFLWILITNILLYVQDRTLRTKHSLHPML